MAFFPPTEPGAAPAAPAAGDPKAARQQRRQDRRQAGAAPAVTPGGTPSVWQTGPVRGGSPFPFTPPPGSGVSPFGPDGPLPDRRPTRTPPGTVVRGPDGQPMLPPGEQLPPWMGGTLMPGPAPGGGGPDPFGQVDPRMLRRFQRRYGRGGPRGPQAGGDKPGGPPGMGGGASPYPPSMQPPPFDPNAPTRD